MDEIIKFLKDLKELFGVIGVVGTVLTFWTNLHPAYAIPVGIVCALFILIWSLFARGSSKPVVKAIAWIGIIVSVIAIVFFLSVGAVLLLRSSSDPGKVVEKSREPCLVKSSENTVEVRGNCPLKISQNTTLVEIDVGPAPEELDRVKDFEAIPRGDSDQLDKITILANKTSPTRSYFRIQDPTINLALSMDITITLKQPAVTRPIAAYINYYYIDHDWLWEARQWISRNLKW
jgi:hypothetical protein